MGGRRWTTWSAGCTRDRSTVQSPTHETNAGRGAGTGVDAATKSTCRMGAAHRRQPAERTIRCVRSVNPSLIPNDFATSARERSELRYNATASRRNSSGYFDGRPISTLLPRATHRIECPRRRVNFTTASVPHDPLHRHLTSPTPAIGAPLGSTPRRCSRSPNCSTDPGAGRPTAIQSLRIDFADVRWLALPIALTSLAFVIFERPLISSRFAMSRRCALLA
jgi:hypothetical protein